MKTLEITNAIKEENDFYRKVGELYIDMINEIFSGDEEYIIFDNHSVEPFHTIYNNDITNKCLIVGVMKDGSLLIIFDRDRINTNGIIDMVRMGRHTWYDDFGDCYLSDVIKSDWLNIIEFVYKNAKQQKSEKIKLSAADCEILDTLISNTNSSIQNCELMNHQAMENVLCYNIKLCCLTKQNEIIFDKPIKCVANVNDEPKVINVDGINSNGLFISNGETINMSCFSYDSIKLIYMKLKEWYQSLD